MPQLSSITTDPPSLRQAFAKTKRVKWIVRDIGGTKFDTLGRKENSARSIDDQ
jgi:hypothetical protein